MAEEIKVSAELIERLTARIEALEKKLDEKDAEDKKKSGKKKKSTTKKVADSISDFAGDAIKESGKMVTGLIDATAEALKEGADAIASMSEDTDKEKLGSVSAAIVSILRKTIDIQKKALDKFEERCEECDD